MSFGVNIWTSEPEAKSVHMGVSFLEVPFFGSFKGKPKVKLPFCHSKQFYAACFGGAKMSCLMDTKTQMMDTSGARAVLFMLGRGTAPSEMQEE